MIHYKQMVMDPETGEFIEEEILITPSDFPVGKTSETGEVVEEDTVAIVLYELDNLDNFEVCGNFEDAQDSAFEYPVLAIKNYGEITADYMQGWFDNNFFS